MRWNVDKEYRLQKLYIKYKGTPLEEVVHNISRSVDKLYVREDWMFWCALKRDVINDTRVRQRRARIRRYVRSMNETFPNSMYLVTLTFTDESLALLSDVTRKRYVREFLCANTSAFMACIDFGKISGREHYHAICACPFGILKEVYIEEKKKTFPQFINSWDYGFHSCKHIRSSYKDFVKSLAYVFKSSSYAFKNADSEHKPFHSRNVEFRKNHLLSYYTELDGENLEDDSALDSLPPLFSCATSSGFEVARAAYDTPYVWFGDSMTNYIRNEST